MKNKFKHIFYEIFKGISLPSISKQLKGVRLSVDPLMPAFHFWRDVDLESHFAYDTFIKEGDKIFDVGGNVGTHSIYFAKKFKNVTIYAFEPLPENAKYFRNIISINHFGNIHLFEKALGAETGKVFFDKSNNNHQGHISQEQSDLLVSIITLDDFITENKVYPSFIKIDVEGYEADVLSGFQKMIDQINPCILIELHNQQQSKKVADFLRLRSYRIFRLENHANWGKNKPFTEIENIPNQSEPPYGFWGTILILPLARYNEIIHLVNKKESQKIFE